MPKRQLEKLIRHLSKPFSYGQVCQLILSPAIVKKSCKMASPKAVLSFPLVGFRWRMRKFTCLRVQNGKFLKLYTRLSILVWKIPIRMAKSIFAGSSLLKTVEQITKACEICQRNNPLNRKAIPPGLQQTG